MKKMTVVITEELEKVVEIEVPDTLTDEEAKEQALKEAQSRYQKQEIVLYADDYTRTLWYVGKDFDEAIEHSVDEWNQIK